MTDDQAKRALACVAAIIIVAVFCARAILVAATSAA